MYTDILKFFLQNTRKVRGLKTDFLSPYSNAMSDVNMNTLVHLGLHSSSLTINIPVSHFT